MKRFPCGGHGEARQEAGGEHAVVAAAEHGRLAVPAAGEPLGLVQPFLVGDGVQLGRVVDVRPVEQLGVVPEHRVLGEVLRHAVARAPALGAAVVAPQVVDRVQVVRPEDVALREVRVQVLHHAPGRVVGGVHRTHTPHQIRRVAVGHHRDQLAGAVQHRVDPDTCVLLGLPDQLRREVVRLGHHRDGLAGATDRARHPHRTAAQSGRPRHGTPAERERNRRRLNAAPACGRTTPHLLLCPFKGARQRSTTGCRVGAELQPWPETASRGLTNFRKDCVTSRTPAPDGNRLSSCRAQRLTTARRQTYGRSVVEDVFRNCFHPVCQE